MEVKVQSVCCMVLLALHWGGVGPVLSPKIAVDGEGAGLSSAADSVFAVGGWGGIFSTGFFLCGANGVFRLRG